MEDSITTHSVTRGFVAAEDIVLNTTPRTRLVFRANIHSGGVRGNIIRQKVGRDGNWKDANEVNFNVVPADCGVSIELNTEATARLYDKLAQLYQLKEQGIEAGEQRYVVAKKDEVLIIDDQNKTQVIQTLLDQGDSQEFWQALGESNPDLASRLAAAKIQFDRQSAIREFEAALATCETDEGYWQKFFERHPWILQSAFSVAVFMLSGETYLGGKMPIGRQGKGGVATDFLFADDTTKSFAVVEIKTPGTHLVGSRYRGEDDAGYDNEVYSMHAELSGGVVQTRNQITVAIENFQTVLGDYYSEKINRIHPMGVLIIGSASTLSQRQKDSFNQFRYALHSLTVITFDELLNRLKLLFDVREDEVDEIPLPDEPMPESEWEDDSMDHEEIPF
jgi:Domain of unknown function (DUF4263)